MFKEITHFVNGKEMPGSSGRFGRVYNPATGQATGQVPFANQKEVDANSRIEINLVPKNLDDFGSDSTNAFPQLKRRYYGKRRAPRIFWHRYGTVAECDVQSKA